MINSFLLNYYIENEMEKYFKQKQKELSPLKPYPEVNEEESNILEQAIDIIESHNDSTNAKTLHSSGSKQPNTKSVLCEHQNRKHYAKGLCSMCYRKAGRTKLAWKCEHKTKPLYALGCCQTCYLSIYYNTKSKRKESKDAS